MKPYKYLLFPILAFPLLTSCSKEDAQDGPVSLNPNVADVSLTRGGVNNISALNGKTIGFYAVNKDGDNDAAGTQKTTYGKWPVGTYGKYTCNSSTSLSPAFDDQTIWLNMDKATIFSCYPAPDAEAITPGQVGDNKAVPTIPVPTNVIQFTPSITDPTNANLDFAFPDNDYMYGITAKNNNEKANIQPTADNGRAASHVGNEISIILQHAFSQIKLVIKRSDEYKGTCAVSKVEYKRSIPTLQNNSAMQLTDGALTNLAGYAEKTYSYTFSHTLNANEADASKKDIEITNYALPCNASASKITVTVDGKQMSINHSGDPEWKAGSIYTYTLKINSTGLVLDGFTIVGWNTDNVPDTTI